MRRVLGIVAALMLLVAALPTLAAEAIERFASEIAVEAGGVLEVTETLVVRVEGDRVRRGIVRDLPLAHGDGGLTSIEVQSVTRNGAAEPFDVVREGRQLRVRIGSAATTLPAPSLQTYELRYRTAGQLRAFDDYDELFWNVTGQRWALVIDHAEVAIQLPGSLPIVQHAGYTGPTGAQGQAFEVEAVEPGFYRARTTAPLRPGEGFSVAIAWPAGAVGGIGALQGPSTFGVPTLTAGLAGALGLGGLGCFALWWRWGRDPRRGTIYPRFEAPPGLSPAAARYVKRRRVDGRTFTACLVSLAVKGAIRITDRGAEASARFALDAVAPGRGLSRGENAVRHALFARGATVELGAQGAKAQPVDDARQALSTALAKEFRDAAFRRHRGIANAGMALTAALAVAAIVLPYRQAGDTLQVYLFALLWTTLTTFIATQIVQRNREAGSRFKNLLAIVPLLMAVVAPLAMLRDSGAALYGGGALEGGTLLAAGLVLGAILGLFRSAMAAPTAVGRRLLDDIEGLELYLGVAEAERLEALHPPDRTPARFETLLPYAIALDLVPSWTAQFAGTLQAAPGWYAGQRLDARELGSRLDRDLSRAAGESTARERSSSGGGSGSGGGGGAGGGGGGGGGSGW